MLMLGQFRRECYRLLDRTQPGTTLLRKKEQMTQRIDELERSIQSSQCPDCGTQPVPQPCVPPNSAAEVCHKKRLEATLLELLIQEKRLKAECERLDCAPR